MEKQQHYIPKCYSTNFANKDGYIYLRDMWKDKIFPSKPIDALKQGYIYTQPVYAESRFDNAIEKFFSRAVEACWTPLVNQIIAKKDLDPDECRQLLAFMLATRVRVPNTMKAVIWALKESVVLSTMDVPADGVLAQRLFQLHPDFVGDPTVADLIDRDLIKISIDPHRAILSFANLIKSNRAILAVQGAPKFLHNATKLDFISSDNPFISHVYEREIDAIAPYSYAAERNIEIVFPITSRIALNINPRKNDRKQHFTVTNEETINLINQKISLYSDRYIFGRDLIALNAIPNFGHLAPIPKAQSAKIDKDGIVHDLEFIFGRPITVRNKWVYDFEKN